MPADPRCEQTMFELSVAHDEGRAPDAGALAHAGQCDDCASFATRLGDLDDLLARGRFDEAPDIASPVLDHLARPRSQWWAIAAIALVGLTVGAVVGWLGSRADTGIARDLGEVFHTAGPHLEGLQADLLVVERGFHPDVPERVYVGTIGYSAPEQLAIEILDTTPYPDASWPSNDVRLTIADGDMVVSAGSSCPIAAMPACLIGPVSTAVLGQPPFADGVVTPLEIVGPGRSLTWSSAFEVAGVTELARRASIQVRSTVAAIDLIRAITDRGAWRELHPTDPVVMWLDEETLVPLRIEVFAADSPERDLWQLRRGYEDQLGGDEPIFVIELANLVTEPVDIETDLPNRPLSQSFVDGPVDLPQPDLPGGFEPHRSGHRPLPDGGRVDVASWSDGRAWLMVESTDDWSEPRLFGLTHPFVESIDLGEGSVGYLSPTGDSVAIHGEHRDVIVSGSVSRDTLVRAAATAGVTGRAVPAGWLEADIVDPTALPAATLLPDVDGWSLLARVDDDATTLLLTGGGSRTVLITQEPGSNLDPPRGPDFSEVSVRGVAGRHDASTATLEWIEDGQVVRMRSDTVGLEELVDIANRMETR